MVRVVFAALAAALLAGCATSTRASAPPPTAASPDPAMVEKLSTIVQSWVGTWTSDPVVDRGLKPGGAWKRQASPDIYRVEALSKTMVRFCTEIGDTTGSQDEIDSGKTCAPEFDVEVKDGDYSWIFYQDGLAQPPEHARIVRADVEDAQNWSLLVEWKATKNTPYSGRSEGVRMGDHYTWTEYALNPDNRTYRIISYAFNSPAK